MKFNLSGFVLMGLCSISNASPPMNFGGTGVNPNPNAGWGGSSVSRPQGGWGGSSGSHLPGGWGGSSSSRPQGGWGRVSASQPQDGWGGSRGSSTPSGWGGVTSSFAYPSPAPVVCYSAVPKPSLIPVTGSITTSTGLTSTMPSSFTSAIAHENWGKGSYTVTSVYPTAHTDYPPCPTGYTSYVNLPAGTQNGSSHSDPSPTSTSSVVVPSPSSNPSPSTPPNPQNLNGNDKPTGAAISSFKLSRLATVLSTISAAALVI